MEHARARAPLRSASDDGDSTRRTVDANTATMGSGRDISQRIRRKSTPAETKARADKRKKQNAEAARQGFLALSSRYASRSVN